uniref:Uncharacterized protein n=1 Tax=Guillardia theta TaxID=55529 RepID=A0A7S4JRF4_GUITH|mmetsp:Transcript_18137/g.59571  ORF Transcript_18137/g.59571 Transcript_18137/m.59571 type:complete len:505 (+) Transcript_18137:240-1754(+)
MDAHKRKRAKKEVQVVASTSPSDFGGYESKASRAEKKKKTRMDQKGLVVELDRLLPKIEKPPEPAKCVGARALGSTGRSLLNILEDAAKLVREIRMKEGGMDTLDAASDDEGEEGRQNRVLPITDGILKEGVLSSESLLVFEADLVTWNIRSMGRGMQEFFKLAPWGSCVGQSLLHLVHDDDKHILRNVSMRSMSGGHGLSVGDRFSMKLMHFTLRRRKTNDKKLRVFEYIICSFRLVHHAKLEFGRLALFVGNYPETPSHDEFLNFEQSSLTEGSTMMFDQDFFGVYRLNTRMSTCNPAEIRQAATNALNFLTSKTVDIKSGLVDEDFLLVQTLQERISGKSMMSSLMTSITSMAYRLIHIHVSYDESDEGIPRFRFHYRLKFPQMLGGFETRWRLFSEVPIDGTEVKLENVGILSTHPVLNVEASSSKIEGIGYQVYRDGDGTKHLFHNRHITIYTGGFLFSGALYKSPTIEPFRFFLQFDRIAGPDKSLISDPGEIRNLLP